MKLEFIEMMKNAVNEIERRKKRPSQYTDLESESFSTNPFSQFLRVNVLEHIVK